MLEGQFQAKVIKRLNNIDGVFAMKVRGGGSFRGIPDIIGVANGVFFGWELKKNAKDARRKTGRIVLQKYMIDKIKKAGGIAEIIYPENFEEKLRELMSAASLASPRSGYGK